MAKKILIGFATETPVACYYQGTFSGMGVQHTFTQAAELAQQFATDDEAQAVKAKLPMAEVLQTCEVEVGK